jgi:hypothetical protein
MPASGGMFGTMDQLQRLDELEGRLQAEDPTRALGDFDDPLPGGQPRRARPARPTRGAGPSEASGILGALKGSPGGKQGKEKGQKEKGKRGKEEPQRDPELTARAFNNLQAGRPMPPPELGPGRATRAENASSVRERSYGPAAPEKPAPKKRSKPAPKKEAPNLGESEQEFDTGPGESPQETEAERILRQLQPPQSEQEPDEDRLGESELEDDRLGESELEDRLGESELEDEPDLGESEQPKKKPRRLVPGGPIPGKR